MRIVQGKHGTYFYKDDEEYCIYTNEDKTVINRAIYDCDDKWPEFAGNQRMAIPKDVMYEIAKKIVEEYER